MKNGFLIFDFFLKKNFSTKKLNLLKYRKVTNKRSETKLGRKKNRNKTIKRKSNHN